MPENFDYKEAPDVRMLGGDGGPEPSRRGFLFWLGLSLNVVVGTLVALPIIGYVFASFRRDKWQAWIDLVPATIDSYPKGQTRLAQYRNPAKFDVTWDGYTADIPCWVRHEKQWQDSLSSPSTAPTLAARFDGSRNPTCSCAPAMAACTTPTARMPPGRRPVASIPTRSTRTPSPRDVSASWAADCRPSRSRPDPHASR